MNWLGGYVPTDAPVSSETTTGSTAVGATVTARCSWLTTPYDTATARNSGAPTGATQKQQGGNS